MKPFTGMVKPCQTKAEKMAESLPGGGVGPCFGEKVWQGRGKTENSEAVPETRIPRQGVPPPTPGPHLGKNKKRYGAGQGARSTLGEKLVRCSWGPGKKREGAGPPKRGTKVRRADTGEKKVAGQKDVEFSRGNEGTIWCPWGGPKRMNAGHGGVGEIVMRRWVVKGVTEMGGFREGLEVTPRNVSAARQERMVGSDGRARASGGQSGRKHRDGVERR